jgi:hypothetical protein
MTDAELLDYVNSYLSYDPESGDFVYKVSRGPRKEGDIAGSVSVHGYRTIGVGPKGSHRQYGAHRLAFLIMEGRMPGIIDHINGIKDDNRYCNLRECTTQQNCMNTSSRRGSSSKYRGVHVRVEWRRNSFVKLWIAGIYHNKKKVHLGYFDDEALAAKAYNEAALEYFGEFAKLNVIEGDY